MREKHSTILHKTAKGMLSQSKIVVLVNDKTVFSLCVVEVQLLLLPQEVTVFNAANNFFSFYNCFRLF